MREKINELIPKAMEAITKQGIANADGVVEKEFKGYIANIGASIIQAGLLPTLAFFQNSKGKNKHSYLVLNAILSLITNSAETNTTLIDYVIAECPAINNTQLNEVDKNKLYLIEEDIMDAIVAIKLALRTFKIKDDE